MVRDFAVRGRGVSNLVRGTGVAASERERGHELVWGGMGRGCPQKAWCGRTYLSSPFCSTSRGIGLDIRWIGNSRADTGKTAIVTWCDVLLHRPRLYGQESALKMVNMVYFHYLISAIFDESTCQFGRVVKAIDSNLRYQFRSRAHVRIMQLTFYFCFSLLLPRTVRGPGIRNDAQNTICLEFLREINVMIPHRSVKS